VTVTLLPLFSTLAIRLLQELFLALPPWLARASGVMLGWFTFHILRVRRGLVQANLARAFGKDPNDPEIRRLAAANFVHYGQLVVEILRLRRVIRGDLENTVKFEGIEHLQQACDQGRGVLVLTAHLGNFDLAAIALACAGFPVGFISKQVKIKQIEDFWMAERSAAGLRIFTRDDSLRELFKALKRNEVLGIILDQHARLGGVWVDFFGRKASTLKILAVLAERSGAPVVPIFARRRDDGTHVVEIQEAVPLEVRSTREETALHNTQLYTRIIEEAVRRNPAQWSWIHRRWKDATSIGASKGSSIAD
jgi:KDO2-lipid IV(A) lauroyltransferase